jgi:putative transposase
MSEAPGSALRQRNPDIQPLICTVYSLLLSQRPGWHVHSPGWTCPKSRSSTQLTCMKYKTLHRYNTPGDAHFLTFQCFHGHPFLKGERSCTWFCESLTSACQRHDFAVWGYVIMPNHVHLLVAPRQPTYNISDFLLSTKESVTRKAFWYRKKSDKPDAIWEPFYDAQPNGKVHFRFWQRGGGYDHNTCLAAKAREKLDYIHNNPVRRGLCETAEEWYWSSAAYYGGGEMGPVQVEMPPL